MVCITLVASTKASDAVTTIVGLSLFPTLGERNPISRELIETFGLLPAIVVGSLLYVGVLVLVVETATEVLGHQEERHDFLTQRLVRIVGYVPVSIATWGLAVHNAYLIGHTWTA